MLFVLLQVVLMHVAMLMLVVVWIQPSVGESDISALIDG